MTVQEYVEQREKDPIGAFKEFFGWDLVDFSEMTVKVRNDYHNTECYMTVNGESGTVLADEVDRVALVLCGMEDCSCQGIPLNSGRVVDTDGDTWEII